MAPLPSPERFLVLSTMRDEGPFIVEWMAWYRALGFTALVAVNDCADRSPDLLDAFASAGWCAVVRHDPRKAGLQPKRSAFRAVRGHPLLDWADWMLTCDADELLVVHGGGTAASLLDRVGRDVLAVGINWRVFGSSGEARWRDALVHRTFLRASARAHGPNRFVKTLAREPAAWARLTDHAPTGWRGDPRWNEARHMVDGEGRPLLPLEPLPVRLTTHERITHRHAQVNHYALRSAESFGLKRGTMSAAAGTDRYTDRFWAMMDRNERRDASALAHAPAFAAAHREALALPDVRRLHHLCCLDYLARLAARAGRRPEEDERWPHHRAEAERP